MKTFFYLFLGVIQFLVLSGVTFCQDSVPASYSNATLGFSYAPPPGLQDKTERSNADIQRQAQGRPTTNVIKVLLAMSSGGDDTSPTWHQFAIESYPRKGLSSLDDLHAEAKMNVWVAGFAETTKPIEQVTLSGQPFAVSAFGMQEGSLKKSAVVRTTIRNGFLVSFAFVANNPSMLKQLTETMKTVRFF